MSIFVLSIYLLFKCTKGISYDKLTEICSLTKPSSSLIIVNDHDNEYEMGNVTEALSKQFIPFIVMDAREVLSFLQIMIPQVLVEDSFERIHIIFSFVVLCQRNLTDFLKEIEAIDNGIGLGLVIRHFSTWLFLCDNTRLQLMNTSRIDNIARMTPEDVTGVQTLMWKADARQWDNITYGRDRQLQVQDVYPNIRFGFNGRNLLVATKDWQPFITQISENGSNKYTGLGVEIINEFAARYNFTYTTMEPEDGHWGEPSDNYTWNGFIGMLQRREVDIGLTYYAYNQERVKVLEYSYFFYHEVLQVFYKKPEVDPDRKWKLLVSIFEWKVYLCGAVTIVAVSILLVVFEKWNYGSNLDTWRRIVPDILSMGITVPLRQGSHVILRSGAGLVLLCFWWLFCIIVTSIYTGNLIAVITVEREKVPFSNLKELSENTEYEIGVSEGSFFRETLMKSKRIEYKNIWSKIQQNSIDASKDLKTQRKHIRRLVEEGRFALFGTDSAIMNVLGTKCGLSVMKGFVIRQSSSLVYPKHSPLARLLSADLQWLFETGWISGTDKRLSKDERQCFVVDNRAHPLVLNDLISALMVCGCGLFAAMVVLVLEMFVFLRRRAS